MSSTDKKLIDVLKDVKNGDIQLPDFQRNWVWDDERVKSLIVSLSNDYPIGAVMFLENGGEANLKSIMFHGVEKTDKTPSQLVLDGQQRITAILNALYLETPVDVKNEKGKTTKRFYYFNINEIASERTDWDKAVISLNEKKQITINFGRTIELDLSTRELEYKNGYIPANIIFNREKYDNWRNGYLKFHNDDRQYIDKERKFSDKVLYLILNYHIPVISISKDIPRVAVCQIFENVNTGGVPLTVFELLTAVFAKEDGFRLPDDWKKIKQEFDDSKTTVLSKVSEIDFLKAITLYTKYCTYLKNPDIAIACKRENILELTLQEYKDSRDKIKNAFLEAGKFLNTQYIYSSDNVPYYPQIIPLSTVIAALGEKKFHSGNVKNKITQWYWCGVLGEMYDSSVDSRFARDIDDLMKWIDVDSSKLPATIMESYFDPCRLLTLQTRNSAAYKGIMALIIGNGAIDFISKTPINFTSFSDENIDIHHIFPTNYCKKTELKKEKYNSIVNKTPLSARSNRIIRGEAPSLYLKRIEEKFLDKSELLNNLKSHLISVEDIYKNDFDAYFIKRAKSILNLISKAMGKEINGLDSEQVKEQYGCSLK